MKIEAAALGMAALACAIGLTVKYGSAYRPVVGRCARSRQSGPSRTSGRKSEEPLVTRLSAHAEAAYDAESNTFYCTLGGMKTARNGRKSS